MTAHTVLSRFGTLNGWRYGAPRAWDLMELCATALAGGATMKAHRAG